MSIGIIGAGAFGTALGVALADSGTAVTLWARDAGTAAAIRRDRQNPRLPGAMLPDNVAICATLDTVLDHAVLLAAIPAQTLRGFLATHAAALSGKIIIACCKGIDLTTLTGPVATINATVADATGAILTGPSFAADIARSMPTALTLACADDDTGAALQALLATPALRLYRTTDTVGAELGGALKNVIAIAAGACIGAGFGESARAALITRGFAEMQRLALALGARAETLAGLSGFGDLVLTCTSEQSRNYRYGLALGRGDVFDPATTVEGAATDIAVSDLAQSRKIDLPISQAVTAIVGAELTVTDAMQALLSRPLKEEGA